MPSLSAPKPEELGFRLSVETKSFSVRPGELLMLQKEKPTSSNKTESQLHPSALSATEMDQVKDPPRSASGYQFIDSEELARRWDVPVSWIRDQVRKRAEDPLPHVSLGKYVRFLWGSPELQAWIERRIVVGNNRRVGRVH